LYPAEGVADDVVRLPPRKLPPGHAASRNTSKVVHRLGTRRTAAMEAAPRKKPAPHRRRRRCRTLQPAGGDEVVTAPPPRAQLDPPFTTQIRPSRPRIRRRNRRGRRPRPGAHQVSMAGRSLGKNDAPPSLSHPRTPAVRRSCDDEQERRSDGWQCRRRLGFCPSRRRGATRGERGKMLYSTFNVRFIHVTRNVSCIMYVVYFDTKNLKNSKHTTIRIFKVRFLATNRDAVTHSY
jgi:hypothetical protein